MTNVAALQARINLLQNRDPEMNAHIINKLKRRIRRLEGN